MTGQTFCFKFATWRYLRLFFGSSLGNVTVIQFASMPTDTPFSAASPIARDESLWRQLEPIGYEVCSWLKAQKLLRHRVEKERFPETLNAFLQQWLPADSRENIEAEPFVLRLTGPEPALQIHSGTHPWVSDARSWALLHLPALRHFWIGELRQSHFEQLQRLVPYAWCVDPTPVPAGAVIADLNLPDWQSVAKSGRKFTVVTADGNQQPWSGVEYASPVSVVLTEAQESAVTITARYGLQEGKIVLLDAGRGV